MRLVKHYVHPSPGYRRDIGQCRVRLYEAAGETPVVVCSELRDDPGGTAHIASVAEFVVAEVAFVLWLNEFEWIENLPETDAEPESFNLVAFADYEPRELPEGSVLPLRLGEASRVPIGRAEAEAILGQHI